MSVGVLAGLRVLEATDESAEYCGRLLAGLGADVVKAEPMAGSPSRHIGPFVDDVEGVDRSLSFFADNVGKRSVIDESDEDLMALAGCADVFVHTMRRRDAEIRGLGPERLNEVNQELIVCALTPFGQSGPWADYLADDLVVMALGGST